MLLIAKIILLSVVVCGFAYAAFILFPRKLRLLRRVGMLKTNADLLALAAAGDYEAQKIAQQSRCILWVVVLCGGLVTLLHAATEV